MGDLFTLTEKVPPVAGVKDMDDERVVKPFSGQGGEGLDPQVGE